MNQPYQHIGKCALCDQDNAVLKESHSIPKFIYQWVRNTSSTPYLRSSDDVNSRLQDGPKEYLLCGSCEEKLSATEAEFAEHFFKKLANYRTQPSEISVTEPMRVCVLSIFWRALLTTLKRDNNRTDEDNEAFNNFLADAKSQINSNVVTQSIFIAPFHGDPPFYNLPQSAVYYLDRLTGAQDIRFFDDPHRYYIVVKLPFMLFYIPSDGWDEQINSSSEFKEVIQFNKITEIPEFIHNYILYIFSQFEVAKNNISKENLAKIQQDISNNNKVTGSDKSLKRSMPPD